MNKLKKMFKKDHGDSDEQSSSDYQTSQQSSTPTSTSQNPTNYAAPQSQPSSRSAATGGAMGAGSGAGTGAATGSSGGTGAAQGSEGEKQGVLLTTTYGDITVFLFSEQTPRTCKNFAGLAQRGYYDGVVFHRIIPDFMIQGGDPTGTGMGGESIYGPSFEDEFVHDLKHTGKGILSMANSGPGTNGSQFFITLAATPHLNGKHTVFGQVAGGMDVVDRIGNARTDHEDRPLEEIKIIKAEFFTV